MEDAVMQEQGGLKERTKKIQVVGLKTVKNPS